MKNVRTNFSAVLLLAALAMTATSQAAAQEYTFTTLAGPDESPGAIDGAASAARFGGGFYAGPAGPVGVAVDSTGNVYVADTYNQTIRKVTPAGVVGTLAGLAGSYGGADGTGSAARFNYPSGVAVDSAGNVYVADTSSDTIRKVTPGGVVTTPAGGELFSGPQGVAVDTAGNVYVADTWNNRIRKVTPGGGVTTLAGLAGNSGSADGTGSAARFNYPSGIAVDNTGNLYVADSYNETIRKVTPSGVVTTLAGGAGNRGSTDGKGSAARFSNPSGVAVDGAGNVYVADRGNNTIRKVTRDGVVRTLAGAAIADQWGNPIGGYADRTGTAARFSNPSGVAVDSAGNVYVADTGSFTIRKVTPNGVVTTIAGLAGIQGSADGSGSTAQFNAPHGVAVDSARNLYVAETGNNTIRQVTPGGVVTTLGGLAGSPGSADGTGSAARFKGPSGVAVDNTGILYVADTGNHTIRKVTPDGVVSTLAGSAGSSGVTNGTGSAAQFCGPQGVAVDSAGTVYVADTGNDTIRKVTPDGVVTTLAGLAGNWGSADGMGSAAQFSNPSGVAVDGAGNVYVADFFNSTIRKVTADGVVTTLAGLAGNSGSADGTGRAALFCGPQGVAVDSAGNVYVADTWNRSIRKVTPGGVVTTLAGLAGSCGSADGTGSSARFGGYAGLDIGAEAGPRSLAVDYAGNLYVADTYNSTIRLGGVACPDAPAIDLAVGRVGELRHLDTTPQTAVAWQWRLIRAPSASSAALSSANVRNPTFIPDVADLYVFQLEATNAAGAICIRTVNLTALPPPPAILLNGGSFDTRSNHFGFSLKTSPGQVVVVETSTDLVNWTSLATNTVGTSPVYFSDPVPPNLRFRFYRARAQ